MTPDLEARDRASATTPPTGESPLGELPCPNRARRTDPVPGATWADLRSAIRASGRFDRVLIMGVAIARARNERDAFDRMGVPQPWPTLFAHELRLTWQVAKAAMDSLIAERIRARLTSAERAARALDLRADMLASAIPPRGLESDALRAMAAELRAASDTGASEYARTNICARPKMRNNESE